MTRAAYRVGTRQRLERLEGLEVSEYGAMPPHTFSIRQMSLHHSSAPYAASRALRRTLIRLLMSLRFRSTMCQSPVDSQSSGNMWICTHPTLFHPTLNPNTGDTSPSGRGTPAAFTREYGTAGCEGTITSLGITPSFRPSRAITKPHASTSGSLVSHPPDRCPVPDVVPPDLLVSAWVILEHVDGLAVPRAVTRVTYVGTLPLHHPVLGVLLLEPDHVPTLMSVPSHTNSPFSPTGKWSLQVAQYVPP